MALPRKLKNMNLYNDGASYMGLSKSVTLPNLTRKMEAWRGAGMDGPVKVDLGHGDDGIQVEWTLGGYDMTAVRQYGITSASGAMLRWAGAVQRDDTGEVSAVEVVVRGRHEEIDFGDAEVGEDTEHKITTTCSYYKLTVDGNVEVEIDLLNFVFIVGGEDRLAEQRKAIGL
ncbi:phage major tail tube protein [Pseudomonas lalucatii]|uniref:Phage major tail tube protein n=1 Tax=Pseudomonas lalucatii TaxID=1424203 RepID=A0ABS5PVI7_9PSED|nr:phage major tail tube protein [Pseudomonas lalucatii]MBS7660551.1 phage major tail tube protein [Pseudomonas lalucatii]MBS7724593.1 phage major tail tube protein [Pseudomonas lalucatii]QVM87417.1 phage major tail tube protein [Pseudomonas lalucatii]